MTVKSSQDFSQTKSIVGNLMKKSLFNSCLMDVTVYYMLWMTEVALGMQG